MGNAHAKSVQFGWLANKRNPRVHLALLEVCRYVYRETIPVEGRKLSVHTKAITRILLTCLSAAVSRICLRSRWAASNVWVPLAVASNTPPVNSISMCRSIFKGPTVIAMLGNGSVARYYITGAWKPTRGYQESSANSWRVGKSEKWRLVLDLDGYGVNQELLCSGTILGVNSWS